ncbi:rod shape-determining protein MreC [Pseudoalteromonas luteoviolacea]|uniref:Cell shape-determining protein MreC n=1 Tax=Pseudoalteromonas luteoviolacea S4060-1 TaxID=1365257 RepID=A0A162B8S2_9GAMM|nr:rod shape-determining protein MreC [Pseudoalteromonas luteoviolacea]KZN29462.1 rod shape-determining protein MreC [Pseudoalteromonas luteoviolacea S2607]KZN68393.1 rod shape-determining protein MreC [Pseudoalteromonas luteoviolacea S4060-1]
MNLLFGRSASLQLRLTVAVVLSIVLIIGDRYTSGGTFVRTTLNTLVSPVLYAANVPYELFNSGAKSLNTRDQLLQENEALRSKQLLQSEQLQQYQFLLKENVELRALLGASSRQSHARQIAQVLSVRSNRYSHQVVINKGAIDGVAEGQAVIDELGLVGQLTQVGTTTSRVLLMTDTTHATPVRILRNDVSMVIEGIGKINLMQLAHVSHSLDIRIGDILVTSGLGGRFPEGYPVAVVTEIDRDEGLPFAKVYAEPIAQLDRIRLLVILGDGTEGDANES